MEYPFKDLMPLDEVLEREGYYKDWTHLDPEVFYSLTQISEYIKTKGYGVDVRLLIAQLAEHFGLKTTQVVDLGNLLTDKHAALKTQVEQAVSQVNADRNALETQFNQSVAQMQADKDAVIANATVDSEVILARGGKATLGQRLDETTKKIPNVANAKTTLKILNPYGNYQNIHPKVLYFENGWNGYKWWVAYTPYPNGDTKKENPCIAVSNNGLDWTVPTGFANVVLDDWNGVASEYNSDTHLVYRGDLNRLELWWRFSSDAQSINKLYRRTTLDGVNWTEKELLHEGSKSGDDHISPAVIFENNKYKMLSVNTEEGTRTLNYSESSDALNWSTRTRVITDWNTETGTITPWHPDFIKVNGRYEMIIQAYEGTSNNNYSSLYYLESTDLIHWTKPEKILSPTGLEKGFDNQGIYRSSLVKVKDIYYVYYSAVSSNTERSMAVAYGGNISALNGFMEITENTPKTTEMLSGGKFSNYDVTDVDMLYIRTSQKVTFTSFTGGKTGDIVTIVVGNSDANIYFTDGSRLLTPSRLTYNLTIKRIGVQIICTDGGNQTWRVMADPIAKTQAKVITLGGTLTDYNLEDIDTILIGTSDKVTFNSFTGGVLGQKVTVVLNSTGANVDFVYGTKLATPASIKYNLNESINGVTLICTNPTSQSWKLIDENAISNVRTSTTSSDTSYTDYDVKNIDLIEFKGSGVLTFNSFVGGHKGQKIDLVLASSSVSITLVNGSKLVLVGGVNYTFSINEKIGVTLVCTDEVQQTWRILH